MIKLTQVQKERILQAIEEVNANDAAKFAAEPVVYTEDDRKRFEQRMRLDEQLKNAISDELDDIEVVDQLKWLPVTADVPGHTEDVVIALRDERESVYWAVLARRVQYDGSLFDADDGQQHEGVELWAPVIQPPQCLEAKCPECGAIVAGPEHEKLAVPSIICTHCGMHFNPEGHEVADG